MICAICNNKINGFKTTVSKNGKKVHFCESCYQDMAKPKQERMSIIDKQNHFEWLSLKHKELIDAVPEPA